MTILEVLKFTIQHSDISFRPKFISYHLQINLKSVYRCLDILRRFELMKESYGTYWVNEKATVKPPLIRSQICPPVLAIILALFSGSSFTLAELKILLPKITTRHLQKLNRAEIISFASDNDLFLKKENPQIWLNSNLYSKLILSQKIRARMGAMYGK